MSTSYGGHQIKSKVQNSTRKTVYPLPQELAEKVIKDRGRNAYVVVFDTDANDNSTSEQRKALKPLKELNVRTDQNKTQRAKSGNEDVKINFSNLEFEDYDSSKTSVKIFTDDETDGDIESSNVKRESLDEGYEEAENGCSTQLHKKSSEPIAGYMVIPPTLSTPLSKFDLSGSSGYFSGGSGNLSELNTTSPLPATEQGFQHPAARQIILMPSSVTSYDGSAILPHQYVNISPMSSLAVGFQNVARIDSPTVFSTKKFTGADAFSLPENSHESAKQLPTEMPSIDDLPQSSSLASSASRSNTPPFKWEHVENRIVIQAPNKKQMDLTIPDVQVTNSKQTQLKNSIESSALVKKTPQKIGDVVIHCDVKQKETVVMVQHGDSQSYAIGHIPVSNSLDPHVRGSQMLQSSSLIPVSRVEHDDSNSQEFICTNPQETTGCVTYKQTSYETFVRNEKDVLDTSLTNIQWLGGIQLKHPTKADKPESSKANHNGNTIQWKRMSTEDIVRIAAECGKTKRPPFSYMTLIQMALHSKEDKRMRLRDICAWIENTFPYYKHTAKPGWRNSIRHNLSLYSIFERETTKKHGSYWTVRDDCPEKMKSCPGKDNKKEEKVESPAPFGGMIPVLPSFVPQSTASTTCSTVTQGKKRVGPQPILPRPSPVNNGSLQTYALIPIQGVTNSTPQSQSLSMPLSSSQESTSSESSQGDSKKGKTRKIAPKLSPSLLMSPPNLLKQAWMDSQFASSSETESELYKIHSEGNKSDNETCAKKPKTGLPQPKIYAKNTQPLRRTKSRRKQKLVPKERELMQDSSDEETEYAKFVSKLEEDLPTPVRKMLDDNVKEDESSAITSTPLKNSGLSPQLPSPFSGFTPLKSENILDNSFLECLRDSPQMAAAKKSPASLLSPKLDFNFIGLTPIKGSSHDNSYNLSKFLAEYPIDANMVDEVDVLPVDLSALNWSSVNAHLDNS